ncbi:prepilin-type N-terminal cleavage/methylation domain-containing protein [Paucibacter oligotrophus]|uniref:Prepilin-type N-terminal cleavage/methylation domain-containing protein n=1 Tax=Roseateles oligotrophus TaxID=1769250 RepID=A0A840LA72_9BURK|nr:prepilin-type N-terminal cleavage/methylation domain-containing protein [Roseateles oligotrophus]
MRARARLARRQQGLTLIELMVCITIAMLLAAAATPFALSWSHQSSVRQTHAQLRQGLSQLKATALRNPVAARSPDTSATLVTQAGQLCLHAGLPTELNCTAALWQSRVPASVTVAGASSSCVALDSNGLPLAANVGNRACARQPTFVISRGDETSQLIFD